MSIEVTAVAPRGEHKLEPGDYLQYRSCDFQSWTVRSGDSANDANPDFRRQRYSSMHAHPKEHLAAAARTFHYAMMASNVYRDNEGKPVFDLPGWTVVRRVDAESGLAIEEVHRRENGRTVEIAMVYKGTDDLPDWSANLSVWREPVQYAQAQADFKKKVWEEPANIGIPITVVGHSLGGGIALNISLRHSTVDRPVAAYVFNTSPRGFYDIADPVAPAERYIVDEWAEFLLFPRWLWRSKLNSLDVKTFSFNFLNFRWGITKPVSEHSIYLLSRALLLVAIGRNEPYATEVFRANFTMDGARRDLEENRSGNGRCELNYCRAILEPRGVVAADGSCPHSPK